MSNLGQTLLIPNKSASDVSAASLPARSNNLVSAVGDSITIANAAASGGTVAAVASYSKFQAQTCNASGVGSYLTWACILPKTGDPSGDGKMRWGGVHATGGATIQNVLDNHINGTDSPLNDSPRPGICVVCVGQNDVSGFSSQANIDAALVKIRAIYQKLLNYNILPIATACPPNNTGTNGLNAQVFNAQLQTMATSMGLIFVDFNTSNSTLIDGKWKTNYNALGTDPVHPSVIAAVNMGQLLRDAIDSKLPNVTPTLGTTANDDGTNYILKNGSMTDDGDADGLPDGGWVQQAGYYAATANGTAWTLGARAGYSGQAWHWVKTSDPGDTTALATSAAPGVLLMPDGTTVGFGFKMEVASWAINSAWTVQGWQISDATKKVVSFLIKTDGFYTTAVAPFVWYQEILVPSGFDPGDGGKTRLNIQLSGTGSTTLDGFMGQLTVRNQNAVALTPPTYVDSTGAADGSGTNHVVTVPVVQNGDVMVCAVIVNSIVAVVTATGWTLISTIDDGSSSNRVWVYYRVASSEPASYTFTTDLSKQMTKIVSAYRGINTSSPVDVSQNTSGINLTTVPLTGVTTARANDMLVGILGCVGTKTFTSPASMTERQDAGSGSPGLTLADQNLYAVHATGTRSFVMSSLGNYAGILVALKGA